MRAATVRQGQRRRACAPTSGKQGHPHCLKTSLPRDTTAPSSLARCESDASSY